MMTGSLAALAIATALFIASHLVLSAPPLRGRLQAALGAGAFRGLYAALALALLVWAGLAYRAAPVVDLWYPPVAMRHLSLTIMALAAILVVAGMTTANPTVVGAADRVAAAGPVGILKVTRHPVMWGIALWGIAHLLANGDAAALILFGGLTLLAVVGPLAQERRKSQAGGGGWAAYVRQTSWLPFLAIARGRTRLRPAEIGWARIAAGLALYAALLLLHPWLFGVDPLAV